MIESIQRIFIENPVFIFLGFFIQGIILYFLAKQNTNLLFRFFFRITKSKKASQIALVIIFFPGTLIHELSHYIIATILFLRVVGVRIFPEFLENGEIKLGHVVYEKRDFFRGILVGIAPFFGAMVFFLIVDYFNLFPSGSFPQNLIFGYLIFSVSSLMFSSRQDLIDFWMIVPFGLIIFLFIYIFDLRVGWVIQHLKFVKDIYPVFLSLNFYFLITVIINTMIFLLLKILLRI